MFHKWHWLRIRGWLINFLANKMHFIFPLSLQMLYALHRGPLLRIILALHEFHPPWLNKTRRILKQRLSPIHMECSHFYDPIVGHPGDWNTVYTETCQPPAQTSWPSLSVLCFLCESRIRTAAFLTCNKTHTFPKTYATIQWISLKEKLNVISPWLILFSIELLWLQRSNTARYVRKN